MNKVKIKKILRNVEKYWKKIVYSSTFKETFNIVIVTTISTIISTLVATSLIEIQNKKNLYSQQKEKLLYDLQTICIGCNKEWMDSAFGAPVFTSIDDTVREEVYIVDIALIRAFFGIEDNACKMFFVTQTTEESIPFMPSINNIYYPKTLGILSYGDIKDTDIHTAYGFFTNGSGRTFYGEGYHSHVGFYYDIYFASVDYGINDTNGITGNIFSNNISENDLSYYNQLDNNKLNSYHFFLSNRNDFYPNTYGVSSLDPEYSFDKLMDYNTFDSLQIKYR